MGHIIGKVYEVNATNMNKLIAEIEGWQQSHGETKEYLRELISDAKETLHDLEQRPLNELDDEMLNCVRLLRGEVIAYRRVLQYLRGLTEREFQLAVKKGQL